MAFLIDEGCWDITYIKGSYGEYLFGVLCEIYPYAWKALGRDCLCME